MKKYYHAVNPPISPQEIICENEILDRGMFEGRAYSKRFILFSPKVDRKHDIL